MPPDMRVLIAEDHVMTRVGLKMLLEKEPAMVIIGEAETGRSAVEIALKHQPDIILMDIGMPEMDGIEATQAIKASEPGIRIIMLTSKDNESDVMAALAAGADSYCMKGVPIETLSQVMHSTLEGAAWLDPAIARLVLNRFQGASSLPKSEADRAAAVQDCPLTEREMEVLHLIVDGHSNPQIADKLCITVATAKAHVHSILQKLCVDDRTQAAVLAMRQGLVAH
jgi:two-component system, NarL family, response regulator LiaR